MANILLQDRYGKVILYDPALHRDIVLAQVTELDIWPDLPQCHADALAIITSLADLELADYAKKPTKMPELLWALVQFSPVNLRQLAERDLDAMIADGRIHFTTQAELDASIVPPEAMTEEDSRHPKQIALREARRIALEAEAAREFNP